MRRFLKGAPGRDDFRSRVQGLLAGRETAFLAALKRGVFDNPGSPYLPLFRNAGCCYGDVAELVRRDGLEGALAELALAGVYLTHDEAKGRVAVRRGSAAFRLSDSSLDNPFVEPHLQMATSGSTGPAGSVALHLGHYRDQLAQTALSIEVNDLVDAVWAVWLPPTQWYLSRLMRLTRLGRTPQRWFSQVPVRPRGGDLSRWAKWRCFVALCRKWGLTVPWVDLAPLHRPRGVVQWLGRNAGRGKRAALVTYPSSAVRACFAARKEGVSLGGCTFVVSGEPITSARRRCIEDAGAKCLPLFGTTELGECAEGCLSPQGPDDMHVCLHKFAVIEHTRTLPGGVEVHPLLFTSLGRFAPKFYINVESGDSGVVEDRECGCAWEGLGFVRHVRGVWSFSKLTAEGMTLPGGEVLRILEEHMPARFGGGTGDYQLIEADGEAEPTQYLLLVNPALGRLDEEAVRREFLQALEESMTGSRLAGRFLCHARQLQVTRERPVGRAGSKSLPVMLRPRGAGSERR